MKKIVLLLAAFAAIQSAQAQINITGAGFTYTQDFNTLDTGATNSSNLPAGWAIKESGSSITTVNNMYRSGNGSTNSGDTYSFGTILNTDRALGSLASGSNSPSYGVLFSNSSVTDSITNIVISHRMEQWRSGGVRTVPDTTYFYYSTVATSVLDTIPANWVAYPSLNLISKVLATTATALDGNDTANYNIMTDSIAVTLAPGQHIIFKWMDKNTAGNDDGLAIDDVSIMFKNGNVGPNSATSINRATMPLSVLGQATSNQVTIGYSVSEAGKYNIGIFDITGRTLSTQVVNAQTGVQRFTISNLSLNPGMYIIKMSNGRQSGVTKAMIQ